MHDFLFDLHMVVHSTIPLDMVFPRLKQLVYFCVKNFFLNIVLAVWYLFVKKEGKKKKKKESIKVIQCKIDCSYMYSNKYFFIVLTYM